jgi:hypothetical protein
MIQRNKTMLKRELSKRERVLHRATHHWSGRDLRLIREKYGYSGHAFTWFLRGIGVPATQAMIRRVEASPIVERLYVEAVAELVGRKEFDRAVDEILLAEIIADESNAPPSSYAGELQSHRLSSREGRRQLLAFKRSRSNA